MISVCIPTYNYDVRPLLSDLTGQLNIVAKEVEIIVIDDDSDDDFKKINQEIEQLQSVKYIELSKNLGRSGIRNSFLKNTQGDYLIFIDCDSRIYYQDYISRYIKAATDECVVCGGTVYRDQKPNEIYMLRWKYGRKRETIPVHIRQNQPYNTFMSNNFLVHRHVLETSPFDESINDYGHEDTLFGLQLKKKNIPVKQIDNPVYHEQLEESSQFIAKTKRAVKTLYQISRRANMSKELSHIKLLKAYNQLKKYQLSILFLILFNVFRKIIEKNLISGNPSILLFDIYKLGCLLDLERNTYKQNLKN
jgi:glycosyltransferase involved in cell wall biosynthesis